MVDSSDDRGEATGDTVMGDDREALLRREYHNQTARISWHELQTDYARGSVVVVAPVLNLVEVAIQLGLDNTSVFEGWIAAGEIAGVTEAEALRWFEEKKVLWAVVAAPWVLVQQRE